MHRVPKVVHADGFVFDDAGDENVDYEDSTPDHVGRRCTVNAMQDISLRIYCLSS